MALDASRSRCSSPSKREVRPAANDLDAGLLGAEDEALPIATVHAADNVERVGAEPGGADDLSNAGRVQTPDRPPGTTCSNSAIGPSRTIEAECTTPISIPRPA